MNVMTLESRPCLVEIGVSAPGGNRTPDLDVRTVLLYPLSYGGGTLEVY